MSTDPLKDATMQRNNELLEQLLRGGGFGSTSAGGGTVTPTISAPGGGGQITLSSFVKPEYLEGMKKVNAEIEGVGRAFDQFAAGLYDIDKAMAKVADPLRTTLFDIQKEFGGFRRATEEMTIGVSQDIREEYDNFANTFTMTSNELKEAGKEKYVLSVDGTEINVLTDVFQNASKYQKEFRQLIEDFGSTTGPALAKGLKGSGNDIALFIENFGLSTKQLGDFIGKEVAQTGKASTTMLDDLKQFSYGLSAQTGISAKLIAKDTVSIINNVERFGNVTVEEAARMSTALKQLGVEYAQLDSMVGAFQGFEGAAQKVGELSAVFGIHLDAVEMMTLANTDQEAMMHKLRDAFDESGQSLDDMNIAQKNLLKDQAGFTDVKQMEMFFSGQVDSMEELQEMTDEAATDESAADAMKAFNQDLATLALSGQTAAQRIEKAKNDMVYSMKDLAPEIMDFRSSTQTVISSFSGEITQLTTRAMSAIDGMKKGIAEAAGGEGFDTLGQNLFQGFESVIVDGIPQMFSDMFLVHLPGIYNKSKFFASSPSPIGLNFSKGITDSFKEIVDSFGIMLEDLNDLAIENSETINNSLNLMGLDQINEVVEGARSTVDTNITEILQQYQKKLEEVQSIVDAPDKLVNFIENVEEMKTAVETLITGLENIASQPVKISYDSKGGAEDALFNVLKDYISVNGGQVILNYPE